MPVKRPTPVQSSEQTGLLVTVISIRWFFPKKGIFKSKCEVEISLEKIVSSEKTTIRGNL